MWSGSFGRLGRRLRRRLILAVCGECVMLLGYFVLNASTSALVTTFDVSTAADRWIPFVPETVWLYMLNLPLPVLLLGVVDNTCLMEALAGFAAIFAIAAAIFVTIPVHSDGLRAVLTAGPQPTWSLALVKLCYSVDGVGNCLPSLHVAYSVYAGLWGCKVMSRNAGRLYLAAAGAITLSTMTIKQHYIADVATAVAVASGVFWMQHGRRHMALRAALPGWLVRWICV